MATHLPLATQAIRGFLWTISASLVQILVIMMVYKSLPTQIVGIFEWTLMLVVLLALVAELGLSEALVQLRQAEDECFDSAFWISLGIGGAMAAAIFATADQTGRLLGRDQPEAFARLVRVLCLLLPFASVSGIFRARLQRRLDFAAVALSEVVSVAAFAGATLALLPRFGIAAVSTGSVIREFALLASLWWSARWWPRFRFRRAGLRQILSFGLNLTGSRLVGYVNTYIAGFVIFPLLGGTAMGYYRLAERLTLQPLTRLATTIFRVSLPTFSAIQDDDALLRRGYLGSVQSLMLSLGPLLVWLFVLAPELLDLVNNAPALTVLRLLTVATLLKVVGTMVGSMFMAKGKANWQLYWSLFSLAVLVPAMYAAIPYSVEGIAAVIAGSSLLFLVVSQYLANRLIGLPFAQYLAALARPTLVVLVLWATLSVVHPWLPGPPLAVLGQGTFLGLLVYPLALRLWAWDLCRQYWQNLRGQARGKAI